jgi:hypothetical protein
MLIVLTPCFTVRAFTVRAFRVRAFRISVLGSGRVRAESIGSYEYRAATLGEHHGVVDVEIAVDTAGCVEDGPCEVSVSRSALTLERFDDGHLAGDGDPFPSGSHDQGGDRALTKVVELAAAACDHADSHFARDGVRHDPTVDDRDLR